MFFMSWTTSGARLDDIVDMAAITALQAASQQGVDLRRVPHDCLMGPALFDFDRGALRVARGRLRVGYSNQAEDNAKGTRAGNSAHRWFQSAQWALHLLPIERSIARIGHRGDGRKAF